MLNKTILLPGDQLKQADCKKKNANSDQTVYGSSETCVKSVADACLAE